MKRILSMVVAVLLLCTCASAAWELPEGLFDSEQFEAIFDNVQLKEKTQQIIETLREKKDEIKSMSDEELEQTIRDVAAAYNIPEMNQEQIDFLVKVCRSFENVEQFGETVKDYQEKADRFGASLSSLMDTLSGLVEQLTHILDSLNNLIGKLTGAQSV